MHGRSVLVAGATGGLGSAIAANLAPRGATLTLVARDPERPASLGVHGHRVSLDLRDPRSCSPKWLCERCARVGVIVNISGVIAEQNLHVSICDAIVGDVVDLPSTAFAVHI